MQGYGYFCHLAVLRQKRLCQSGVRVYESLDILGLIADNVVLFIGVALTICPEFA